MHITVVPGRFLTSEHVATWAALQAKDGSLASPFLGPEFTRAVAAVRDDVYVAVLEEDGRIAGFFPHQRTGLGVGRAVGHWLCDVQGVVTSFGTTWSAPELVRRCGLVAWEFTRVRGSQAAVWPFHYARRVSAIVDLSGGYDAYAEERRHALKPHALDRKARKLEREAGPLRFEAHSSDRAVLDLLMAWKLRRYAAHGYLNAFAIPWVRQLFERLHATRTPDFAGMLSVLHAGDQVVAAHLGIRSRDVWHYWCPSYDPRFARCSPGLLLLHRMIQHAASIGMRAIELGGSDEYAYKQLFMNRSELLLEGTVGRVPAITAASRWLHSSEAWIRRSPLRPSARRLLRAYRRARHRFLYEHPVHRSRGAYRPSSSD